MEVIIDQLYRLLPSLAPSVYKVLKNLGDTSKFLVLEWWHKSSCIPRTFSSGVTCETDCHQMFVLGAQTDSTVLFVREKDFRNCAENIWRHVAKFSPPNNQVPWTCAVLHAPSQFAFSFTLIFIPPMLLHGHNSGHLRPPVSVHSVYTVSPPYSYVRC